MRLVDPLEPQPGDFAKIYTPHTEVVDDPINWIEGVVVSNDKYKLVLGKVSLRHKYDTSFESKYYIEDEA